MIWLREDSAQGVCIGHNAIQSDYATANNTCINFNGTLLNISETGSGVWHTVQKYVTTEFDNRNILTFWISKGLFKMLLYLYMYNANAVL